MKRNDDGQAVLTDKEQGAYSHREYLTGTHHLGVTEAAEQALGVYDGKPTKEFVDWLSNHTLTIVKGEVKRVEEPANA